MKYLFFLILSAYSLHMQAQTAKIRIDVQRHIGEIDPNIYGVFMEPILASNDTLSLAFPPHSFTQIKASLK